MKNISREKLSFSSPFYFPELLSIFRQKIFFSKKAEIRKIHVELDG